LFGKIRPVGADKNDDSITKTKKLGQFFADLGLDKHCCFVALTQNHYPLAGLFWVSFDSSK